MPQSKEQILSSWENKIWFEDYTACNKAQRDKNLQTTAYGEIKLSAW